MTIKTVAECRRVIKRMAYGYRNSHNFRQRILLTNHKEGKPKRWGRLGNLPYAVNRYFRAASHLLT